MGFERVWSAAGTPGAYALSFAACDESAGWSGATATPSRHAACASAHRPCPNIAVPILWCASPSVGSDFSTNLAAASASSYLASSCAWSASLFISATDGFAPSAPDSSSHLAHEHTNPCLATRSARLDAMSCVTGTYPTVSSSPGEISRSARSDTRRLPQSAPLSGFFVFSPVFSSSPSSVSSTAPRVIST